VAPIALYPDPFFSEDRVRVAPKTTTVSDPLDDLATSRQTRPVAAARAAFPPAVPTPRKRLIYPLARYRCTRLIVVSASDWV
jgi:hypothetical protein